MTVLFFPSCKKEYTVKENTNLFGGISGLGGGQSLNGVIETADHNFILWGSTNSNSHGMQDGFVMKVDGNFNILWNKTYGGFRNDGLTSLAMDEEGNMLVTGYSESFGPSIDSNYSTQNSMFYLVYINKDGNEIWDTTFRAPSNNINKLNYAYKTLYLPNKTFCVIGSTFNFTSQVGANTFLTNDAYLFGVDKQANFLWGGRYFNLGGLNNSFQESGADAVLSSDGNIIFQMSNVDYSYPNYFTKLIKIPFSGPATNTNSSIWKGQNLNCLGNPGIGFISKVAMEHVKGDEVVLFDLNNGGLLFTDSVGNSRKFIKFDQPIYVFNITKYGSKLLVTGIVTNSIYQFSYQNIWLLYDLEGNLLEQHDLEYSNFMEHIDITKTILSENSEVLVFGTSLRSGGKDIIMLRFDLNGNLIKN